MLKINKFRKPLKIVAFVVFLVMWVCWISTIYININKWLDERVETVVLHSRTLEEPKFEYPVYLRRNASQTFHFSEPQNIEKIVVPVVLPNEAGGKSDITITIKKDDLTVWDEKTHDLQIGKNELVIYPDERFKQTTDLRVIFTTPERNDIPKAPKIYREETGNISLKIFSSDVKRNLIFKKDSQPQDYVRWFKWASLAGLIMVFPAIIISPLVRGK